MSQDTNDKGQKDRSEGKYDPPSKPNIHASDSEIERYSKDRQDYDTAWERTRSQQDQSNNKYDPPSVPSDSNDNYSDSYREQKKRERETYDDTWESSQDNTDKQREEKDGGCFITSACVEAKQLPDNCFELETLRKFRDTYVAGLPEGKQLIKQYYLEAPQIVRAIDSSIARKNTYNWLYDQLIIKSLKLIKEGRDKAAYNNYKAVFENLRYNFLNQNDN